MNMECLVVVNNVVCEQLNNRFFLQYGRKKQMFPRSKKVVENHVLTGKFRSSKLK